MAKFRHSFISTECIEVAHKSDQTLLEVYQNCLKELCIEDNEKVMNCFVALVDGEIEKDWNRACGDHDIAIAAVPRGDGAFKQVVTIAVIAAAGNLFGPAGSIGAALLMYAINKPQQRGMVDSSEPGYGQSQMYTISGQGNAYRKYGIVPRPYGRHRIFPALCANPYTEISNDPGTGELVQYYHAIYDFGFGPLLIEDIKIGDTPILEYRDVEYRVVDPNRPDVSEGIWDDETLKDFTLYKGDNSQTEIGTFLNENEGNPAADPSEYQTVRNPPINQTGVEAEYTVNVLFPQGLRSIKTDGVDQNVIVRLRVEFADVGTEDWRAFDDDNFVSDFYDPFRDGRTKIYADRAYETVGVINYLIGRVADVFYDPYANTSNLDEEFLDPTIEVSPGVFQKINRDVFDFRKDLFGRQYTDQEFAQIDTDTDLPIGTAIYFYGTFCGVITQRTQLSPTRWNYRLDRPSQAQGARYGDTRRTANTGNPAIDDPVYYVRDYLGLGLAVLPGPEFIGWPGQSNIRTNAFGSGETQVVGNSSCPFWGSFRFKPFSTNDIKIRLTRVGTSVPNPAEISRQDSMQWATINTKFAIAPINVNVKSRHNFMELRIKATDQINGSIDKLNAICTSYLQVYDDVTTTWNYELTTNPAWVMADIITGEVNKRALPKARLDTTALLEWAAYCDEIPNNPPGRDKYTFPRFECNFILDYKTTLAKVIEQVGNAAQASLNIKNGLYGVLIDREKTIPVQVFTPRNSAGFQSTRQYSDIPDALRVKFVDPQSNWEIREQIVYNDGFDLDTAEVFEDFETFGCTNFEQAWRFGRYMLAQAIFRQENISINVDFENLVATRGDFVLITQDVMKVGGTAARVKTTVGNRITIDEDFITQPLTDYGYTVRQVGGITTDTLTVVDQNTFDVDGVIPQPGELIAIGEVGKITFECIIKSITPSTNESAKVVLVEKNDEIFLAEEFGEFSDYDPLLSDILDINATAPGPVQNLTVLNNSFDCDGAQYIYFVDLTWGSPIGNTFEVFEIWANDGNGFVLDGVISALEYRYQVGLAALGNEHEFKVLAVNAAGVKLTLGEVTAVTATPVAKTTPPSDVAFAAINITNETLTFDWDEVSDCDVNQYKIRYSKNLEATWATSIPMVSVSSSSSAITVQARVGTYLVKAVDFAGNESANAASAITSIPELFNLNVISETNDFPTFPGSKNGTVEFGTSLILQESSPGQYLATGEYTYQGQLDLGEIYTVRLQALIDAQGFTTGDLMSNWITLDQVLALSNAGSSDWDAQAYYRSTDEHNTISSWPNLASIATLAEGFTTWTPWRKFTAGDFTGRIFQFKLVLSSFKANVTPRVIDAVIRADMPDRIFTTDNLSSSAGGVTSILYDPSFKGPGTTPSIQITIDNAQSGDYHSITNKTLDGFDIEIFDSTDTRVVRQFDVFAKGFGRKTSAVI